jgi:adenine-specific DNA methylase
MDPRAVRFSYLQEQPNPTLLEENFPFRELSYIAKADRRGRDPVYAAHRWWARRPAGVIRGILLAALLPSDTSAEQFWTAYGSDEQSLRGLRIFDPFVGGGSIPVEASRLGAEPHGSDVDPLAVRIVRHELSRPPVSDLRKAAESLLR